MSRPSDQIQSVINALPLPVMAVDRTSRVLAANQALRDLFGNDGMGRPFVTFLREPRVVSALETSLAQTETAPRTLRVALSVKGRDLPCSVTLTPFLLSDLSGVMITFLDQSATEDAEAMQRGFVANVSHELRTPLTALMGFIETLRGPARHDSEARDRFLSIMTREANRMNRLVDDLLSLSKLEAEQRQKPTDYINISNILQHSATIFSEQAKALDMHVALDAPERAMIEGDSDQITQVLGNLIENALKYGKSGGFIGLRLYEVPHEPMLRGPAWAVEVSDRGEGIDNIHLPRLTERFYRIDRHRSRAEGGTGLGLAIVKHIVQRHRGRLRIESTKGEGSRFTVLFPQSDRKE